MHSVGLMPHAAFRRVGFRMPFEVQEGERYGGRKPENGQSAFGWTA